MNIKLVTIIGALVMLTGCVSTDGPVVKRTNSFWNKLTYTDSMDDTLTVKARGWVFKMDNYTSEYEEISFECSAPINGAPVFSMNWGSDGVITSPNSPVSVTIRVDDNKPLSFIGKTYTNSYSSGFIHDSTNINVLLTQLVDSTSIVVRIANERSSRIDEFTVKSTNYNETMVPVNRLCGKG